MKRAGFTMIELIFVIVILGILAAVALPKMNETANEAKIQNAESYVASFNRTVGSSMWAKAIRKSGGSIKDMNYSKYAETPDGYTIDISKCDDSTTFKEIGTIDTTALASEEKIYCKNGDSSHSPLFAFASDGNVSVQNN